METIERLSLIKAQKVTLSHGK